MQNISVADSLSGLRIAMFIALGAVLCLFVGCGGGPDATEPIVLTSAAFHGTVHGGQQPVTQSNIALFATSSSGYGATVSPLATATTDTSGSFDITTSYTCPTGQQMYIVATGGNPGLTSGTDNSAIFLMAALGACPVTSAIVDINEVTTVAAAYALSGFVPPGGVGLTEANVKAGTAMAGVTTSSTNTQGLSDAFLNANNIVNYTTGLAYTATPTAGSTGVVPQSIIHALADILQTCVNATTPAGGNCPSLFTNATPPSGSNIAAPVNVFQAALDIAQYPGDNVGALYGLISTSPAFPYTLPAAPNDWTIGVTYTGSLLVSGTGLGISSADQVYVTGTDYLLNFSPQGVGGGTNLLASYVGTTTSPTSTPPVLSSSDALREIAFDKTGNMFITDGSVTGVYEYSPATTNLTFRNFNVAPVSEANANTYAIAIDGDNDVWTSSYSKATCASVTCPLIEFPSTATASPSYPAYTPFSTFGGFGVAQPTGALGGARGIAFDVKTGNLWITSIDDNLAELFKVTPSTAGVASATAAPTQLTGFGAEAGSPGTNTAYGTFSVAVDSTGRAWFVVAGGPVSTKSGSTTSAISSAIYPVSTAGVVGTAVTGGGLSTTGIGANIVIDGNNNLFVGSQGSATTSAVIEYSPALSTMLSPNIGFSPGSTYAAGALSGGNLYEPDYLEVDKSGALWVLSSGSGASGKPANVIQILGLAAPTDPVLVDGNNGVKP